MSAFKGTPGPWCAGEQCEVSGWVDIRIPGYSRNPVACATPAAAGDAEARRDAETLANARLIAAAPELLEALKDLFDRANHHTCTEIGGWFTGNDENFETLRKAEQAIAKATGGES